MRYQLWGRNTGLRVSELALGAGSFGTRWNYGASLEESRRIFDRFVDAGGNFIDNANNYQFGEAEEWLGQFMQAKRNELVIASKYTFGTSPTASVAEVGNNRRNMILSVEASLRRLKTDRIDMLWAHTPDEITPTEEILRGFDDLARSGKIVYAGLSNFPAWRAAHATTLAEIRATIPIAGLQVEYSLVERTAERELIPMARAFGLGLVGWSPLGGGLLTGKYRRGETGRDTEWNFLIHRESDERKKRTVDAVLAVASALDRSPGQVAIAWAASKGVIPILGARTVAQLEDNLGAATLTLTDQHVARLDEASAIEPGYPHAHITENRPQFAAGKDVEAARIPVR